MGASTDPGMVSNGLPAMLYVWAALVVILLIIEIFTLGLTTIWFAGGAACALAASLLRLPLVAQIVIFLAVSVILLFITRPFAVRHLNNRTTKTNAEAFVGKKVRVISDINNLRDEGQIFVGGIEWTARSSDDTVTFSRDDVVRIVGIEGVKMIVEKCEEDE